jgi:hypothetical protein
MIKYIILIESTEIVNNDGNFWVIISVHFFNNFQRT